MLSNLDTAGDCQKRLLSFLVSCQHCSSVYFHWGQGRVTELNLIQQAMLGIVTLCLKGDGLQFSSICAVNSTESENIAS